MEFNAEKTQAEVPQLMKLTEVCERTRLCRATLYHYVQEGRFPRPIRLGKHSRWLESEVRGFIDGLVANRQAQGVELK